jgi:hypothetical protein
MALLSNKQQSKLTMFHANDDYLQVPDNITIYSVHPKFTEYAGKAHTNLGKIDAQIQKYQTSKHGNVVVKTDNKKSMAKACKKVCRPMVAFSKDTNHTELLSIFDYSMSDIFKLRDLTSIEQCRAIVTEATKWLSLTAPFMVDANLVQALTTATDAFESSLEIVKNDSGDKISIFDYISSLFDEQDRIIEIMVDLSIYFEDIKPGFFERYNTSLRIIDTAHGHINIKAHVVDEANDKAVYQADCKLHYGDKILETKSSEKGNFLYKDLESGLYKLDVEHFAFMPYSDDVEVYDDKTTNLTIKLNRKTE